MQIRVRTQTGKMISLQLEMNDTIEKLKQLILDMEGIPLDQQRIVFSGKLLQNDKTLADYQIVKDSTVNVLSCTLR